ncbi:hypothetical protein [Sphingobacterium sp. SYP-B4668]|uniref:hypothetical protein n=1 Tax=Sphingobacterium sp. SYP-B4668 TaxID=2996035 RepID=UPI0022DE939D|nr:hypothetical protein [Sphingobacterium sp. SYP-B4668]
MNQDLKDIVSLFAASLSPIVAIIAIYIGVKNYKLAKRKRNDDLFDRRYKFLKDFEKAWKTTGPESMGAEKPHLEWDELEAFAQEAYYLFGKDIADHIRSYEGKSYGRHFSWVPDLELAKPFNKYLCFERE